MYKKDLLSLSACLRSTRWNFAHYMQADVCLHAMSLTDKMVSGFPAIHRSWLILQYFVLRHKRQGEVKSYTQWQTQSGRSGLEMTSNKTTG